MVFSSEDRAIIKNDYEEKGWTTYRICKEYKSKEWVLNSVQRLLKRFKEDGSMKRRTGSGRTINVTTDENAELVEELICSQEDFPYSCVIIKLIILTPVIINFLTIFPNNKKVAVLWEFF